MIQRSAQCACGDAKIVTSGEPYRVISCHCSYCKKRTGSVFQVCAWFRDEQVLSISGETKLFKGSARSKGINYRFCPKCGTTLYWTFSHVSGYHGIAVGCFADPNFPKPNFEMYTEKRQQWQHVIEGCEQFLKWPPASYLV